MDLIQMRTAHDRLSGSLLRIEREARNIRRALAARDALRGLVANRKDPLRKRDCSKGPAALK